jgi:hypothetical protein
MAEVVTLAAPLDPALTVFRIALLSLDWGNATIKVHLRDWNGTKFGDRVVVAQYTGAEATTLMVSLNKLNLSVKSLHTRVMEKLQADGKLPPCTISGAAD